MERTELMKASWVLLFVAACSQGGAIEEAPPGSAPEGMAWIPGQTFRMGSEAPLVSEWFI